MLETATRDLSRMDGESSQGGRGKESFLQGGHSFGLNVSHGFRVGERKSECANRMRNIVAHIAPLALRPPLNFPPLPPPAHPCHHLPTLEPLYFLVLWHDGKMIWSL